MGAAIHGKPSPEPAKAERGYAGGYTTLKEAVEEFKATRREVFVPFSKAGAELLFEVVIQAYERLSLIVSTNLPFEQWTEVMGSERLTGALLDRLTHRVHILEAHGESYRLKDAPKGRKKAGGRGDRRVALRAPHRPPPSASPRRKPTLDSTLNPHIDRQRGSPAMERMGLLRAFTGSLVHDCLSAYYKLKHCGHFLCNAHLLRELTYLHEERDQAWAGEMIGLLAACRHRV